MIDSYKNIERLRYRLNVDLNGIKESIDKNSSVWYEEMLIQISSAIISALAAGAITTSEFSGVKSVFVCLLKKVSNINVLNFILGWFLTILVFLSIYVLIFISFEFFIKKFKRYKKNNAVNKQSRIDYQKEFDNIACDSIFVAIEYKTEYKESLDNPSISDSLRTFYFYEIIHYLEKACITTRNLCMYKDEYIKTSKKANGVEIYRIHNMIELIKELLDFADSQRDSIVSDEDNNLIVTKKVNNIRKILYEEIHRCMETL